jgi:hypothetical protein
MTTRTSDPLRGVSESERQIMSRLLRMPPEQHKAATKPATRQGEAQRQRRRREKEAAATASHGA